jgi:potassium-transporting ATPase KdpC subunit
MKKYLLSSIRLTGILLLLCSLFYSLLMAAAGKLAPGGGSGEQIYYQGRVVGYRLIGQQFSGDHYFQGRPSAVNYNASGSGGSNKGPSNPDYLQTVRDRIDTFLVHNPGVRKSELPAELVTASGSGLDPDISPAAAYIQVKRVAAKRGVTEPILRQLIAGQIQHPLWGFTGPATVNVLQLNIALDQLTAAGHQ